MPNDDVVIIERFQAIINETQDTIRAYDTKSEILSVILTLVLGLLNFGYVSKAAGNALLDLCVFLATGSGLITVLYSGLVLFPKYNPNSLITIGGFRSVGTYFVLPPYDVDQLMTKARMVDWVGELATEVMKTAAIRDKKHGYFKSALSWAAFTVVIVIVASAIASFHLRICNQ